MKLKKRCAVLALAGVLTIGTGIYSQAMVGNKLTTINNVTTTSSPIQIKEDLSLESLAYQKDGFLMLPLRLTCEKLGFEVVWHGENSSVDISKGNMWTSITLGDDSYFIGRRVPFSLGIAPQVINNSTYVPVEFFEKILNQDIFDIYEKNKIDGHVTTITESKNGHMLVVEYGENQKVVFNVNDYTKITNQLTNKEISINDIVEGDRLVVIHDSKMTNSFPAQTFAFRIGVIEKNTSEIKEENIFRGDVTEIKQTHNSTMLSVVYGEKETVIFIVSDKTKVMTQTGKEMSVKDIVIGDKVIIIHNNIFTRSIPAQTNALKIEVCYPVICPQV